ncbi:MULTISPECIES: Gfo/Idh/MocA family protein [Nocardiaceae]|jgi:predicted dehydrogenase|uniref:Gfo/Idh/MocA family protein n=1 Tax=Nocardiaceae TaxID=85025 RepID=UPI00055BCAD5|nr:MULTISPECIES: Gfo/Idh/MocA family oxidoreductase [Rhodococcus]OZF06266.1 gfo/Idh/MocA family oxidoreductase [Rhodococcus sp. 15-1189-1-1a]OZF21033.1 gfo/Idh/MocA family oxidoreductase [Rhodococcus sp. 14-2686-1-2]
MRLGVVGYGVGGRYFHVPFVQAAEGVELVGIVTRSPERAAQVELDAPGTPVYGSLTELIDAGVDAVTITTPPETRRELVLEAVARGVHVVADKPFAPDPQGGQVLVDAAADAGVLLSVFQNRRWDADILTLRGVIDSGKLGRIWRVESRFDLDEPATLELGPTGGLLRDLGSHLVDQALWLFGPATSVYARMDWAGEGDDRTDSAFVVDLDHEGGVHSTLSATKVNHFQARQLRVYGTDGSYYSDGTDVQAQAVFAGRRPMDEPDTFGYELENRWGTLHTDAGAEKVPSAQGSYKNYYRDFAAAVRGDGPQPVPASEVIHTLEVLDAARRAAETGEVVRL